MVQRIGQVYVAHQLCTGSYDLGGRMALMEGVRRAVQEADPVLVQPPDQVDGVNPVLDEVVGMGLQDQLDTFALEDGQQLVH